MIRSIVEEAITIELQRSEHQTRTNRLTERQREITMGTGSFPPPPFCGISAKWKKSYYQKNLNIWKNNRPRNIFSWSCLGVWLRKVHNFRHCIEGQEEYRMFSAESADPSSLKKKCIVSRDNDKDCIVLCSLVYSEKNSRVYH